MSSPAGPVLGGQVITLWRSEVTGTDAYGNDTRQLTPVEVPGCSYAPGTTSEHIEGTVQAIEDATFYLPAGTAVSPEDEVTYAGTRYRVMGFAETWTSPFTQVAGPVRIRVRVVTGAAGHITAPGQAGA